MCPATKRHHPVCPPAPCLGSLDPAADRDHAPGGGPCGFLSVSSPERGSKLGDPQNPRCGLNKKLQYITLVNLITDCPRPSTLAAVLQCLWPSWCGRVWMVGAAVHRRRDQAAKETPQKWLNHPRCLPSEAGGGSPAHSSMIFLLTGVVGFAQLLTQPLSPEPGTGFATVRRLPWVCCRCRAGNTNRPKAPAEVGAQRKASHWHAASLAGRGCRQAAGTVPQLQLCTG